MNATEDLAWMLDEIVAQPGVRHAMLMTQDGLPKAHSAGMDEAVVARANAALVAIMSLSVSAGEFCGARDGLWEQTMMVYDRGYIMIIAAAPGTFLAVAASRDADIPVVAAAMHAMVGGTGHELDSVPRVPDGAP